MKVTLSILVLLATLLASRSPAQSETALPVSTIAALLDEAQPGSTVIVPPGRYEGNLVIRKPVILEGQGKVVIDAKGDGTVVEILSPDVTFRGFKIQGSGKDVSSEPAGIRVLAGTATIENNQLQDTLFGIDLRQAPNAVIRKNSIRGKDLAEARRGDGIRLWWSHNSIVEFNDIKDARDMVFWYSEGLTISKNTVTDSRYGLHFMYSHDTVLKDNRLEGNSVGIYLMYSNRISLINNTLVNNRGASGYGIGLKDCDDIVIQANSLLSNRVGVYLDNSPSSVGSFGTLESNTIAFNQIGILATPNTHDNVLTNNAFLENEEQAAVHGRGSLDKNLFSRGEHGNFWSDYAGFDRDGDGIGDLAYEPRSFFNSLLAKQPNLRIFVHSPAQQAVEFTARALPELRPTPTLTDPAPMTRIPTLQLPLEATATSRTPMLMLGLLLLALPALLICGMSWQHKFPSTTGAMQGRPIQ